MYNLQKHNHRKVPRGNGTMEINIRRELQEKKTRQTRQDNNPQL